MNIKATKLKSYILVVICFLITLGQNAFASNEEQKDRKNYIGMDVGIISQMIKSNHISFVSGYGDNAYAKNPLMYGIFAGHKFNDWLGVEVEYEAQNKKSRTAEVTFMPGLMTLPPPNSPITLATEVRTEHVLLLLHGTVYRFHKKPNANIWTQLGISYSQIRANQVDLSELMVPISFKQKKVIPVVKLGINYDWTNRVGFRLYAGWRHLSMLKPKSNENPTGNSQIKLKDGVNCAIGIYFKF